MGGEFSRHQDTDKICIRCLNTGQTSKIEYIDYNPVRDEGYNEPQRIKKLFRCSNNHTFHTFGDLEKYNQNINNTNAYYQNINNANADNQKQKTENEELKLRIEKLEKQFAEMK